MRTGRKLSQASKDKISNALKGKNNGNYGKPLSPEHKFKISRSMLNYWKSVK